MPLQDKSVLVEHLRTAIQDTIQFCEPHGVDFDVIRSMDGFERIKALDDAVEALLVTRTPSEDSSVGQEESRHCSRPSFLTPQPTSWLRFELRSELWT